MKPISASEEWPQANTEINIFLLTCVKKKQGQNMCGTRKFWEIKTNQKESYICNQKEAVEISWPHNVERDSRIFNTLQSILMLGDAVNNLPKESVWMDDRTGQKGRYGINNYL